MSKELTNEVLEAMAKCKHNCPTCGANEVCSKYDWKEMMQSLATALLDERATPKVWEFAPITADCAVVYYYLGDTFFGEKTYTRELPKTRARQIAEKISAALSSQDRYKPEVKIIEAVLEKYAEELEQCSMDYLPQLFSMSLLK